MTMTEIIKAKRDGNRLSERQIQFAINGYTDGSIPDYQMSALAMAIWFRGMDSQETACLTRAMLESGDRIDLSQFADKTVDKHSTGGVGDKTSLIVLPIAAACGAICAKMSGRGLGHTGGTIDKLEALPGYRTQLGRDEFLSQVKDIGIALIGQTSNLTPADKKLYALRDVTATVDSLPLIASSIMSKKLAAGAHSVVLDVKTGSGAFLESYDQAAELAKTMVDIGKSFKRNVCAVITNMDVPLGYNIGNALEVAEAIDVLRGRGPEDLREICTVLASVMLEMSLEVSHQQALKLAQNALDSGAAFEKFCVWIERQGSDRKFAVHPELLPQAEYVIEVKSEKSGYISHMNTHRIGECASMLGAGRTVKDQPVDAAAGIIMTEKTGDFVKRGQVLARLYTNIPDLTDAVSLYLSALEFSDTEPKAAPLVLGTIK